MVTLPAPGGAANAVCMQWAAAARHARQRRGTKVTPSSLVLRAATATSGSPTANAVPSAVDRSKRDKVQSCTGSAKGGRCWHKSACRQGRGYARSAHSTRSTHRYLQVPVADRVHKTVGALLVTSSCVTSSCVTSHTIVRNQKNKNKKIKGSLHRLSLATTKNATDTRVHI